MNNSLGKSSGEKRKRAVFISDESDIEFDFPSPKKAKKAPIICSNDDESADALKNKQHFNLGPKVTSLKVEKEHLSTYEQVTNLARALKDDGCRLKSLDLSDCELSDARLSQIISALRRNKSITDLNIEGNSFSPDLAKLIRTCPLQTLNLSEQSISDKALKQIALEISECRTLTSLSLSDNVITGKRADSCPGTILAQNSSIVKLDLSSNLLDDECIARLISAIQKNGNIAAFNLAGNKHLAEDIGSITNLLQKCNGLKGLYIRGIAMAADDEVEVLKAIERHSSLEGLSLTLRAKDGLVRLGYLLKDLPVLTTLNLELSDLDEIKLVARMLRENKSVESLTLFAPHWSIDVLEILRKELTVNKTLKGIEIYGDDDTPLNGPDEMVVALLLVDDIAQRNLKVSKFDRSALVRLIEINDWPEIMKHIHTAQKIHEIDVEDLLNPHSHSLQERIHFFTRYLELSAEEAKSLVDKKNRAEEETAKSAQEHDELRDQVRELENRLTEAKGKLNTAQGTKLRCQLQYDLVTRECEQNGKQRTGAQRLLSTLEEELAKIDTLMQRDIRTWSINDVALLLTDLQLQKHCPVFQKNFINGDILTRLTTLDLVQSGLSFKEAKLLQRAIFTIQKYKNTTTVPAGVLRWKQGQVTTWLKKNKFDHLVDLFTAKQIEGGDLAFLDNYDLSQWLGIQSLVDKDALEECIKKLRDKLDSVKQVKQKEEAKKKVPKQFICPITTQIMQDPVMTFDGHIYERVAIEEWLSKHDTSPMTNEKLSSKVLIPGHHLKSMIADFNAGKT